MFKDSAMHSPSQEASNYLRRLASAYPEMPTQLGKATVISIETMYPTEAGIVMFMHLDDGTTIRLDVSRYARDAKEI